MSTMQQIQEHTRRVLSMTCLQLLLYSKGRAYKKSKEYQNAESVQFYSNDDEPTKPTG